MGGAALCGDGQIKYVPNFNPGMFALVNLELDA